MKKTRILSFIFILSLVVAGPCFAGGTYSGRALEESASSEWACEQRCLARNRRFGSGGVRCGLRAVRRCRIGPGSEYRGGERVDGCRDGTRGGTFPRRG